jgi:hypothetical protein
MPRPAAADHHQLLATARDLDWLVRDLKRVVARLVIEAHDRGATWEEIGTAFGVSRQSVHERFGPKGRRLERGGPPPSSVGHRGPTISVAPSSVTKVPGGLRDGPRAGVPRGGDGCSTTASRALERSSCLSHPGRIVNERLTVFAAEIESGPCGPALPSSRLYRQEVGVIATDSNAGSVQGLRRSRA